MSASILPRQEFDIMEATSKNDLEKALLMLRFQSRYQHV
jgi:hypothetical protein